jgi:hypothetical protein
MDVTHLTGIGRVNDDIEVLGIGLDARNVAPLETAFDGERVKPECVRENGGCRVVASGDVNPHEPIVAVQKGLELGRLGLLCDPVRDPVDVHG